MNRQRWPELLLPIGIIACLMVIFMPLPPGVMDILLAANITISVVILLSAVYVKSPLELSVFPSLLLATTLARLALNIGTTRLILSRGALDHDLAAGGVIQSFGEFVAGNNIAIGLVIFSIIVVIQFVVITKGTTRISEVAARFALDGMPGRQMAIDADLNSGLIDSKEAQARREEVSSQADFYGAMDGASKFVRGDAIAGIAITAINIVGGLVIGLSSQMSLTAAAETFTKLTIGDGLASQLPALLISLAAGLLVTRSSKRVNLPRESVRQVFNKPIVLIITAGFLGLLVFTQLPKTPLLLIATGCLIVAWLLSKSSGQQPSSSSVEQVAPQQPTEVTIDKLLSNDMVEMELGVELIPLADPRQAGTLLGSITQIRKELAASLGIILPKIRIRDNLNISPQSYRIVIQSNPISTGDLMPGCFLAVDAGNATAPISKEAIQGIFNQDFNIETAYWISGDAATEVRNLGYEILSATDVLANKLKSVTHDHATQLLTRDATKLLIDEIHKTAPAVVDELIPGTMKLAEVQQILKNLLVEGVSIRPLGLILETLGDHANKIKNRWDLTELVRKKLARHITSQLTNRSGTIQAFKISPDVENRIACAWERENDQIRLGLPRPIIESLVRSIQEASRGMSASGIKPVCVVEQSIRPVIAELALTAARNLSVIGNREIEDAQIEIVGEVSAEQIQGDDNVAA